MPGGPQGPQLVVLVPTRELGVQEVLLVYKLLGGNTSSGIPGDPANIFAYNGPRGIKVLMRCHCRTVPTGFPWKQQKGGRSS